MQLKHDYGICSSTSNTSPFKFLNESVVQRQVMDQVKESCMRLLSNEMLHFVCYRLLKYSYATQRIWSIR